MTDISTLRPIDLFQKHGMDTLEISKLTGASEAEVYNEIGRYRLHNHDARKSYKNANARENRRRRNPRLKLIKYAGHPGQ